MNTTLHPTVTRVESHIVGHCYICGIYRTLDYCDDEIGLCCNSCVPFVIGADIELNYRVLGVCRPTEWSDR